MLNKASLLIHPVYSYSPLDLTSFDRHAQWFAHYPIRTVPVFGPNTAKFWSLDLEHTRHFDLSDKSLDDIKNVINEHPMRRDRSNNSIARPREDTQTKQADPNPNHRYFERIGENWKWRSRGKRIRKPNDPSRTGTGIGDLTRIGTRNTITRKSRPASTVTERDRG